MNRITRGLLAIAAVLSWTVSTAQLKPVDHGSAAIDNNGLMWANTVGIQLTWDPAGGPGTAQAWVANLNATDYGGFNDWALPTGDFNLAPNTTTNQLGELFNIDCGNTVGQQTSLTIPRNNCRALSALGPVMQAGMSFGGPGSNPGDILISSGTLLPPDPNISWAVYETGDSAQRSWDGDSSFSGIVGEADVLAVRLAGPKPHQSSVNAALRSVPEPNTFALLGVGLLGLGLMRWLRRAGSTHSR